MMFRQFMDADQPSLGGRERGQNFAETPKSEKGRTRPDFDLCDPLSAFGDILKWL